MLFVVPEELVTAGLQTPLPVATRVALSRLLQAHLDGHHLVVCHPRACRVIEQSPDFSIDERAAAARIRARFAEHGRLREVVGVHAEVVDWAIGEPQRVGQTWQLSTHWIAAEPLSATSLIAEDLNDISVLEGAAFDFRNRCRLFGLATKMTAAPGGGGNTSRVLDRIAVHEQRIALCIVDSDRECDGSKLGPTAQSCIEVDGPGVYEVKVTAGRSLENSLPWRLIDLVRQAAPLAPSVLLATLNAAREGSAKWANLKRGKRRFDIPRAKCEECIASLELLAEAMNITSDCCPTGCAASEFGACGKVIYQGYGGATLGDVGTFLKSSEGNTVRHERYLPSPGDEDWQDLGRLVFAYGLATMSRRI
jgi:hypothetical protein